MKRYIAIAAVKVENRQRTEHDPSRHQELLGSIESLGLLHPPVLRLRGDAYVLVAGERRLRAMADLHELSRGFNFEGDVVPPGLIPYTLLSDMDELSAMEAELDENIKRADLSWQDRCTALDKLEQLRAKQAVARGTPPPTPASIALETRGSSAGSNTDTVRKQLILADRKSTRLNSSHLKLSRMPSSA